MNWITLISGTGMEVMNLSHHIQKNPLIVISNNPNNISESVMNWTKLNNIALIKLPIIPSLQDYQDCFDITPSPLITLHGYMRILPINELTGQLNIYDGHPGLIDKYPFLKGKDPQKKAYQYKMKEVGSVIHRVVQEVDSGEIIHSISTKINSNNIDDYYTVLRKTSLESWIDFFNKKLYL
jgi:folate-dependent phosphoribosylglycinamide formyltransferase PurN